MNIPLQQFLVGVLVLACAMFAAWRLSTVRLRLRALEMLGALPGLRSASWLTTLRRRTLEGLGGACGGCAPGTARPVGPKASRQRHS